MHILDFLVQPQSDPRVSLAQDAHFLHVVTRSSRTRIGILRVYDFAGDVLSLGRYHLAPLASAGAGVHVYRRQSGGRAMPFGEGLVGLALFLPHRSALFGSDPFALAPYQVLNRYVRGILEGCRLAGLEVFYPGRDLITVNRRVVGMVSFEVQRSGAMLFEAVLAVRRNFSALPAMLQQIDPTGMIKADLPALLESTSLERELHTALNTAEVAELLRRG